MLLIPDTLISPTEHAQGSNSNNNIFTLDRLDHLIDFIRQLNHQPSSNDHHHPVKTARTDKYFIFWSSRDSQTGKMWCPDCEEMEVNLDNVLKYLRLNQSTSAVPINQDSAKQSKESNQDEVSETKITLKDPGEIDVVYVYVGGRDEWKSADNPFKKSPWNLTKIPTVLKLSPSAFMPSDSTSNDRLSDKNTQGNLNRRIVFQDQRLIEKESNDFGKLLSFLTA